jgi:breast cancer 2 susceptibility protein
MSPPRMAYSARILVMQDAQTVRRPGNRRAQVTVWDVTNLHLTDGKPGGYFEAGQRFHVWMLSLRLTLLRRLTDTQVTNLHPTHHTSWMGHEHEAQIFLCTKSTSRWTKIRSTTKD